MILRSSPAGFQVEIRVLFSSGVFRERDLVLRAALCECIFSVAADNEHRLPLTLYTPETELGG